MPDYKSWKFEKWPRFGLRSSSSAPIIRSHDSHNAHTHTHGSVWRVSFQHICFSNRNYRRRKLQCIQIRMLVAVRFTVASPCTYVTVRVSFTHHYRNMPPLNSIALQSRFALRCKFSRAKTNPTIISNEYKSVIISKSDQQVSNRGLFVDR